MFEKEAGVHRRVVLGDAGHEVGKLVLHTVALGRAGVLEVEPAHELVDTGVVGERGEDLAGGEDSQRVDALPGALGVGVEEADAIDHVAPEVDTGGPLLSGAIDIDDAAAPGGGPGVVNEGADAIADNRPMPQEGIERQALAEGDRTGSVAEGLRRQRLLQQARDGRDDKRRLVIGIGRGGTGEGAEGAYALVDGAGLDGEALVGEHLGLGEVHNGDVVVAVDVELFDKATSVIGVGTDDDQGTAQVAPEAGDDEGLCRFRGGGGGAASSGGEIRHAPVRGHTSE